MPGSTLVAHDSFPGATGWSSNVPLTVTSCGALGLMLGGYGVFGSGAAIEKTFDVSAAPPHSVVRVELDFFRIDSWDAGEKAEMYIDGTLVWSQEYDPSSGHTQECGSLRAG